MRRVARCVAFAGGAVLAFGLSGPPSAGRAGGAGDTLPARLSNREFWQLVTELSEPNGTFRSDNLVSNEMWLQQVIPELVRRARPARVYMGVGPEQNFTYISALRPHMAFIVDVRRGNRDLHLMYKALFELSADRGEFVSRLFSRKRPEGLDARATVSDIFGSYANVEPSENLYRENLKDIRHRLLGKHGLPLSEEEQSNIETVYHAFFTFGPLIQYSSTGSFGARHQPTYAELMVSTDGDGQPHGYLSTEAAFGFLKDLEARNLLVPVVGNFAGTKAIRAVAKYLKEKGGVVSAFYLSNVEQYLSQDGLWASFCRNVASLPLDGTSTFIRAVRGGRYGVGYGFGLSPVLDPISDEVKRCGE